MRDRIVWGKEIEVSMEGNTFPQLKREMSYPKGGTKYVSCISFLKVEHGCSKECGKSPTLLAEEIFCRF